MGESPAVSVVRENDQAARCLAHPMRLTILERLREPDSGSGLARSRRVPRQVLEQDR